MQWLRTTVRYHYHSAECSPLNLTPLSYIDYRDAPSKPDNLFYSPVWTLTQTYALGRVLTEGYLALLLGEKPPVPSERSFLVQLKGTWENCQSSKVVR